MYSKIKIFGHPIHPMLVAFPIAFYTAAFVSFLVYQLGEQDPFVFRVGYLANWVGVIAALLAAVPGFLDWSLGISKQSAARRSGLIHMIVNTTALLASCLSLFFLHGFFSAPPTSVITAIWLTGVGVVLTMVGAFLGLKLVATHKVGIDLSPEQERLEAAATPELHTSQQRKDPPLRRAMYL